MSKPWSCTTGQCKVTLQVDENVSLTISIDSALEDSTIYMDLMIRHAACLKSQHACE